MVVLVASVTVNVVVLFSQVPSCLAIFHALEARRVFLNFSGWERFPGSVHSQSEQIEKPFSPPKICFRTLNPYKILFNTSVPVIFRFPFESPSLGGKIHVATICGSLGPSVAFPSLRQLSTLNPKP